ncbi:phosphotransferase family protein [Leptolyngbya sp. KIOST-1]|uniref:phosphotransferase family protein n=1 Tax=Leptolyngbya sp. KIOST-1 TaxID=1229172 RepID=UPI00055B0861|nr:phosphotransferase [Leptolyngbya sp. KIOST-1]
MSPTPHTLLCDPALAFLAPALTPAWVGSRLGEVLGRSLSLRAIRPLRHKLGRRCLIAYDIELAGEVVTVVGKVRSRGLDHHSYELQRKLWHHGFEDASADGVSVPEPLGVMPELHLWLQRWVPGRVATELLPQDVGLAERIAGAIAKLHRANIPARKCHTPADEIRILQERLPRVAQIHPQWQERIEHVLQASAALAKTLPQAATTGIHRDFYPDQVLVSGDRLYLLDLDLYCQGDPALDIGNFVAHLSEQSLRRFGHPDAFTQQETALVEAFCKLDSQVSRGAIATYKTLTLVRHIYISTQHPHRRATTAPLLSLCEARLAQGP